MFNEMFSHSIQLIQTNGLDPAVPLELPSSNLWFESWVWTDYRLAVLFTVVMPLVLLTWAFVQKNDIIQKLLTTYWRVASLLAITVYLMIAGLPISFISAMAARILIPISLWFWADLNEEIDEQPRTVLKQFFSSWRWAITTYSILGAIAQAFFVRCAFSTSLLQSRYCQVWLDPPWMYKQIFHNNVSAGTLGIIGFIGLTAYIVSLSYFVLVKLSRQGRSALE